MSTPIDWGGAVVSEGYLGDHVSLSNDGCDRWYRVGVLDPDAPDAPEKLCKCPKGRCWYDEQVERRSTGRPALTPEAWDLRILREAGEDEPPTRFGALMGGEVNS